MRILTIDHVRAIEQQTGDPFYTVTESDVNVTFFMGWMSRARPGVFNMFNKGSYDHRIMYEETDHTEELGDSYTNENVYLVTVLEFINEHEAVNDEIWQRIDNMGLETLVPDEDEEEIED